MQDISDEIVSEKILRDVTRAKADLLAGMFAISNESGKCFDH
jgi:hypothetical protein